MGIQAVLRLVQLRLFQRKPLADLLRGRKHDPPDPQDASAAEGRLSGTAVSGLLARRDQ
jgi:hypothetical protein